MKFYKNAETEVLEAQHKQDKCINRSKMSLGQIRKKWETAALQIKTVVIRST